jgi:hypothetical protein
MWRPTSIGEVIASRRVKLMGGSKGSSLKLSIGRPVRDPEGDESEPWFCPISIEGPSIRSELHPIAGVDAFQALILALQLLTDRVVNIAERKGQTAQWLDESERVILGRHILSQTAEDAFYAIFARFWRAARILDSGTPKSRQARDRAVDTLKAIAFPSRQARKKARRRN